MAKEKVKGQCKIILIPADPHENIREETLSYTEETEVSCVQDHAKVSSNSICDYRVSRA